MKAPLLPTIGDYVQHWAQRTPDAAAAADADGERDYARLAQDVDATASWLLTAGVRRGDRVAGLARPDAAFWTAFLATVSIGGVWVGLNPKHTETERHRVLADAQPTVVLNLTADPAPVAAPDRAALVDARAGVTGADAAALVYTSGSSGAPKGALLPHRGFTFCSVVQAEHWYTRTPRVLVNLPVNHVGCLGDLGVATLVAGGAVVLQPTFTPAEVLSLLDRRQVTVWGAVPAMFELCVRDPAWAAADLSSLELIVWSGGAMPLPLARTLSMRGARLLNCYGMTETVGSITYTGASDSLDTLTSTVGRPDPRYQVRIVVDGRDADVEEQGEIQVRGDHLFLGYHRDPHGTGAAFDNDWFRTGDRAVRQGDGSIRLVGRTSDMFKSGGYNIYPREIETALESHPAVTLAAVVGVPDSLYGEVGHAWVVAADGLASDALRDHLRRHLANYKIPKAIHHVDALPLLPIGKVDKRALLSQLKELV